MLAALIARLRGGSRREPSTRRLGPPGMIAGAVWLTAMLINILIPSGIQPERGALQLDWITLLVVVVIVAIGAVYTLVARPARRIPKTAPKVTVASG